jgi:hypothetical protein
MKALMHTAVALTPTDSHIVEWNNLDQEFSATWHSENGTAAPKRIVAADDTTTADQAFRWASEGTAMVWHGDFHNAKQLLQAVGRRIKPKKELSDYHQHRMTELQKARTLGMLLIPIEPDFVINLRRAPDVQQACIQAYGPANTTRWLISLRELLGVISAYEWRKNGIEVAALNVGGMHANNTVYPHYGVFSPIRQEYLTLIAKAPLPTNTSAFDIGTGTGVIAALLARRGVKHITATDISTQALECAAHNIEQLGVASQIQLSKNHLFPDGKAPLIVCNPPWLPGKASSALEHAIYDHNSQMLTGFLNGLKNHLSSEGEGWLVMSNFAELVGLRSPTYLTNLFEECGLSVIEKLDTKPSHPKTKDTSDAWHSARSAEITSLWRLRLNT